MATVAAIVGSTTVTLNDRSPFFLRHAKGMSRSVVRPVTAQGPAQHGDTDMGYRMQPREMELVIGFYASTDALLDAHRDTLRSIFRPLSATPIKLRYTRDDGGVRQLDCNLVGKLDIKFIKEHRPGHYHEATVRLRAPDPAYYNPTAGSVSVVGTSLTAAQWWLAGGLIGSAQAVDHGTAPAQGSVWVYQGTPSAISGQANSGYTIAWRGTVEPITDGKYAFYAGASGGSPAVSWSTSGTTHHLVSATYGDGGLNIGTAMQAGTHNYFVTWYPSDYALPGETTVEIWSPTSTPPQLLPLGGAINVNHNLGGTARRWRSNAANDAASRWTSAIAKYAVYVPALTGNQAKALNTYMDLSDNSTDAQTLPIAYLGDLPESPVLSIRGPVSSPSITNLTTGMALDFGTIIIGAGTTYIIDTRYGLQDVLVGTVSHYNELTADSDLGEFRLVPAPIATGGTNVLYLNGTAMGAATQFAISYYNRYQSY